MLLAAIVFVALGQGTAPMPTVELASNVKAVAPGKPFIVALHMKLPDGWHNYYANPGESGVPTTITWTLPAGYKAGPILWPAPKRIVIDKVPMYGYEGDLWLPTTITPPGNAKVGTAVELRAKADWLLCAQTCVPQSATLRLRLGVGRRAVANNDAGLSRALGALPRRATPWTVEAMSVGPTVRLTVQDAIDLASTVQFFPADPESFTADLPRVFAIDGGFQVDVPLSRYATKPPTRLTGILALHGTGKTYWIDTPVTWIDAPVKF